MKQISKKDLISLITESNQNMGQEMPMDEMAEIKGANPWDENYNGKEANTQVKARYFTRQHGLGYKDLSAVDVFIFNIRPLGEKFKTVKGDETGRGVDEQGKPKNYRIIVLCHDNLPIISENSEEQSGFEKRFTNWVESMKSNGYTFIKRDIKVKDDPIGVGKSDFLKDGDKIKDVSKSNKSYYQYRELFGIVLSKKTGIVNSVSENINIILMKDIREVMDEQDFVNHLAEAGIPIIYTPQNLVYPTHTRRNQGTDVYGSRTNEKIAWGSNSVLEPFKDLEEFVQYMDLLTVKKAGKRDSKYNKRQFQSGPRKGMMQFGDAIYVQNLFNVLGEADGNGNFIWKLSFKGLVGTNIKSGDWTDNLGLRPFVRINAESISKSAEPIKGCVLSNPEVHGALIEALQDIKNKLFNIQLDKLIDEANTSVKGFFDAFTMEGVDYSKDSELEPQQEPELEPQAAGAEKPKKGKKITKEAIESMIKNMLHEAINK